jgi:hypothetical protein
MAEDSMSGEYVVVQDGLVVEHCCGDLQAAKDCRAVPDGFGYLPGIAVASYDAGWNLLPLAQRIAAGLVVVSPAEKVVGESVIALDALERIAAGLDTSPLGMKLVDGALESMSIAEQVAAGQMTQATADTINAVNIRAERDALLSGSDWTQVPDVPDSTQKTAWQTYRQALRDLTKQGGFPSGAITWPTPPTGVTP